MKRYWKLIAVVTVVVLTIGTFYIQSALSASSYPEVTIQKESGNAELVEQVKLNGYYMEGNSNQRLTLTSDESTFQGEKSFFERLRGMNGPRMNKLQEEYRGFMRGKSGAVSSYLDSKEVLAYADVVNQSFGQTPSEMEFDIAVLNKETDETNSFSLPVPNRALYSRAYVVDVQMVDGDVKVLTQNYLKPSKNFSNSQEIHMYSFDLDKQELNGENEIIIAKSEDNRENYYINSVVEMDEMSPHKQMVFSTQKEEIGPEGMTEESKQEYLVYNFAKDKKETIAIPEKIKNVHGEYLYNGGNLFSVSVREKVSVIIYNLTSKKIVNEIEVESASKNRPVINASKDKLYLLQPMENDTPKLIVYDVKTGDTLYKGKITPKEPAKGDAFFDFYQINVN